MGTIVPMERKCGIKGCVEYVVPGAYVEVIIVTLTGGDHGRIEVCESHYDRMSTPSTNMEEPTDVQHTGGGHT